MDSGISSHPGVGYSDHGGGYEPGGWMKANVLDFSRIKVSCNDCNLSELCLPRGLHSDELTQLDRIIKRSTPLHKGDYLFRAGDPLGAIFAVRSGAIKLYALSNTGEEQILGFYLPGELVGLDAINAERHRGRTPVPEAHEPGDFP